MNTLTIHADEPTHHVSRHIYGHFAEHLGRCVYEGFWVGDDSQIPNTRGIRHDTVEALRRLKIPNLRWPGGCFADEYHWKDGIGPRESRPPIVNTHWGGGVEPNDFGTHEFFDLCEMLEADAYVCGNVGSGTVQEMSEWVEYITHPGGSPMSKLRAQNGRENAWKLPFFGVGNESWGCGGQMRPEYYADEYRRYATFVRAYGGQKPFKIACGPDCGRADRHYEWTDVLMREAAWNMDGLSLHYYTMPDGWDNKGAATDFDESGYFATLRAALRMDELLFRHGAIMDKYDPQRRVALIVDEWGTWWDVEPGTNPGYLYQQNTVRDALVAALTLHTFHKHATRVRMANIAQTVNVLQAMLLTDGAKMLLTPTYHVFEMLQPHHDAQLLPVHLQSDALEFNDKSLPALNVSATRRDNALTLSIAHTDPNRERTLEVELRGATLSDASGRVLSAPTMQSHNTFESPDIVAPQTLDNVQARNNRLTLTLPPMSVSVFQLQLA